MDFFRNKKHLMRIKWLKNKEGAKIRKYLEVQQKIHNYKNKCDIYKAVLSNMKNHISNSKEDKNNYYHI